MTHDVIAKSMAEATIHAPVAAIDLTEWVFTLTDTEYQACSKDHIAAVSLSESIGPDIGSRVKVVVIWMFTADVIDAGTTRFTNSVEVRSNPGYLEALKKRGVPFATASEAAQHALSAHNAEETPLFAGDIEHKALAERWDR
jgi:hypothetical protein